MAIQMELKVDTEKLRQIVSLGGDIGEPLKEGIRLVFIQIGNVLQRSVTRRSGARARSWLPKPSKETEFTVTSEKLKARGVFGSNLVYDLQRRFGGPIRPKNAKWLAIPLPPALTPAGVARKKSPREYDFLVPIKTKAGNLLLARPEEDDTITPFYVLKREVHQEGNDDVEAAVDKVRRDVPAIMDRPLQAHIDAHLRRAG